MIVAGQASNWLRRRKVQAALGLAGGLVAVPVAGLLPRAPVQGWFWPIALASAEASLAIILAFLIISLFIDRAVERARAAAGLPADLASSPGNGASSVHGLAKYARRVAARQAFSYKVLKAYIALLASEGVVSPSFAEMARDMAAASRAWLAGRVVRRLVDRACDDGLLERVEGRPRYRIVAPSRFSRSIAEAVRSRVPGLAEERVEPATVPATPTGRPSRRRGAAQGAARPAHHAPARRERPPWVAPASVGGDVAGLVPSLLRRLRLAGRPVTRYPRLDARTGVARVVAEWPADVDGPGGITAVLVPAGAEVDPGKLHRAATARHRLHGTALSILPPGTPAGDGAAATRARGPTAGARLLVDRTLLEMEQFYLCAEEARSWVFLRRSEVRRARVPEVSVLARTAAPGTVADRGPTGHPAAGGGAPNF